MTPPALPADCYGHQHLSPPALKTTLFDFVGGEKLLKDDNLTGMFRPMEGVMQNAVHTTFAALLPAARRALRHAVVAQTLFRAAGSCVFLGVLRVKTLLCDKGVSN